MVDIRKKLRVLDEEKEDIERIAEELEIEEVTILPKEIEFTPYGAAYKVVKIDGVPTKVKMTDKEIRELRKQRRKLPPPPEYVEPIVVEDEETGVIKVIGPWGIGFPVPPQNVANRRTCSTIINSIVSNADRLNDLKLTYPITDIQRRRRGEIVANIVNLSFQLSSYNCSIAGATKGEIESFVRRLITDPYYDIKSLYRDIESESFLDSIPSDIRDRMEKLKNQSAIETVEI